MRAEFSQDRIKLSVVAPEDSIMVCSDDYCNGWKVVSAGRPLAG